MWKRLALCFALLSPCAAAKAQLVVPIVASCGGLSLTAGQSHVLAQDLTGNLCTNAGASGIGTVATPNVAGYSNGGTATAVPGGGYGPYVDESTSSQFHADMIAAIPSGSNIIGKVYPAGTTYVTVAASQTAQVLQTSTGAVGDYLSHCVVFPTTVSPQSFTIYDNSSAIDVFAGGTSSLSNLVPFTIPIGAISVSGAWKVTTGTGLSMTCAGKFS